jgi:hypothetical protein
MIRPSLHFGDHMRNLFISLLMLFAYGCQSPPPTQQELYFHDNIPAVAEKSPRVWPQEK